MKAMHLRVYDEGGTIEYIVIPENKLPEIRAELLKNGYSVSEITFVPVTSTSDFPDYLRQ